MTRGEEFTTKEQEAVQFAAACERSGIDPSRRELIEWMFRCMDLWEAIQSARDKIVRYERGIA